MRRAAYLLGLCALWAGLGAAQDAKESTDAAPERPAPPACDQSDCFFERQIRDAEFLGDETMIVFVGRNRCAYLIRLHGTYCGYSLGPMGPYLDFEEPDGRLCLHDTPYVTADPFNTEASRDLGGFTNRRMRRSMEDRCQVLSITPLNDDELLEVYAEAGARQPLPPVGSGEISVEEGREEGESEESGSESEAPAEESAAASTETTAE